MDKNREYASLVVSIAAIAQALGDQFDALDEEFMEILDCERDARNIVNELLNFALTETDPTGNVRKTAFALIVEHGLRF